MTNAEPFSGIYRGDKMGHTRNAVTKSNYQAFPDRAWTQIRKNYVPL